MSGIDELTNEYRRKGLSDEVIESELLWPFINFLCCACATKKARETCDVSVDEDLEEQYRVPDDYFSRLSKLLKCIVFVQDMNKSTRSSEVLGENAKYILKDFLGKPIFTGSSEEGLAKYGNESMNSRNDINGLSYRLNHDIDIMYESDKMVAYEIDSYTTPIEESGVLNVLMRPGKKAGYVTLQKCIPEDVFDGLNVEGEGKAQLRFKVVKLYPQPREYVGQDFVFYYLQTLAFLKETEWRILPRDCSCIPTFGDVYGDNNRYGDLCGECRITSLKEIYRGKGMSPTKLWSDIIRIEGPSVFEMSIIENEPVQSKSKAPMNDAEAKEQHLPTVKPQLNDIFSSPGRKTIFVDHVPAIRCASWPSAAWEFIVRERPSGWPSDDLVKQIVEKGCHVIPRGIEAPPNTKLKQVFCMSTSGFMEWRLSFSVAEKILVASLNEVQVKCYMLLKMLHEKIEERIGPFTDDKESYGFDPLYPDSYHLKTTFFWVCEKIPLSEWNDDNLGSCFIKVLDQLILFLENGTFPNYFIPSSNIVPDDEHTKSFLLIWATFYQKYCGYPSKYLFESLQTTVWSSLWKLSEERPPGSTPQDLKRIKRAIHVDDVVGWVEEEKENSHDQMQQTDKEEAEDAVWFKSPTEFFMRVYTISMRVYAFFSDAMLKECRDIQDHSAQNDDHLKSSCSKSSTSDMSEKTENDTDAPSKPAQWPCKLDKVLAQIFAAISKFIYTHGNTYGLGVNTARAAFYEEEAKKLLPAGWSLSDLEEYELSDSSDDSDHTYDLDESEDD